VTTNASFDLVSAIEIAPDSKSAFGLQSLATSQLSVAAPTTQAVPTSTLQASTSTLPIGLTPAMSSDGPGVLARLKNAFSGTDPTYLGYAIGFIVLVLIIIIASVIVIVAVVRKRAAKRKLAEVYGEGRPLEQFETISAKPPQSGAGAMHIERLSEVDSEGPTGASMHRFQSASDIGNSSMPLGMNQSTPELERMRSAMDVRARATSSFPQAQPTLSLVVEPLTDSDE